MPMTRRVPHWLYLNVTFDDKTQLTGLDPGHIKICTASQQFCDNVRYMQRGVFMDHRDIDQYKSENIYVCFGKEASLEFLETNEDEYQQSVVYYKQNSASRYIMPHHVSTIVFHTETKQCLTGLLYTQDQILMADPSRMESYFLDRTVGRPVRKHEMYEWFKQKQMIEETSLKYLTHYLRQTDYGAPIVQELEFQDKNRRHLFGFQQN